MPPKRKAKNVIKGIKPDKKPSPSNANHSLSFTEESDTKNKNISGKNNISNIKFEYPSPTLSDKIQKDEFDNNQKTNKGDFISFALNNLLKRKAQINSQGSICWKSFIFPSIIHVPFVPKGTQQYFGLDLIEAESERTIWTHKPSIWKDLFETVEEFDKTGQVETISTMFHGILACPVRATPKGPNKTQTFASAKGQKIQHWIMLIPIPADGVPYEYIQKFIKKFEELSRKPYIKSAYKQGVEIVTKHEGLLNSIDNGGNYWTAIDNASQKDIIFQSNSCLSEVLKDSTIEIIVHLMFGVEKDSNTWNDAVRSYAYGN